MSEAYSEPSQTSEMELFTKIVNGFKPLIICIKSSFLEIFLELAQGSIVWWVIFRGAIGIGGNCPGGNGLGGNCPGGNWHRE